MSKGNVESIARMITLEVNTKKVKGKCGKDYARECNARRKGRVMNILKRC